MQEILLLHFQGHIIRASVMVFFLLLPKISKQLVFFVVWRLGDAGYANYNRCMMQ
jgi:hypothetical protein